jgi:hypothetical protein
MHHSSIRDHLSKCHPEKSHNSCEPGYVFNSAAVPEPESAAQVYEKNSIKNLEFIDSMNQTKLFSLNASTNQAGKKAIKKLSKLKSPFKQSINTANNIESSKNSINKDDSNYSIDFIRINKFKMLKKRKKSSEKKPTGHQFSNTDANNTEDTDFGQHNDDLNSEAHSEDLEEGFNDQDDQYMEKSGLDEELDANETNDAESERNVNHKHFQTQNLVSHGDKKQNHSISNLSKNNSDMNKMKNSLSAASSTDSKELKASKSQSNDNAYKSAINSLSNAFQQKNMQSSEFLAAFLNNSTAFTNPASVNSAQSLFQSSIANNSAQSVNLNNLAAVLIQRLSAAALIQNYNNSSSNINPNTLFQQEISQTEASSLEADQDQSNRYDLKPKTMRADN